MHEANTALFDILVNNSAIIPFFFKSDEHFLHLWIGKKAFRRILKRWFISRITGQNVQKLQILLFFASFIARILNRDTRNV